MVDAVTQWEIVASVERIAESYLVPLLKDLLIQFSFKVVSFHSDNGSEYVNQVVADLLNRLLICFTRSRPRRPNDNGLVESKNCSVIRKNLGYTHMPQSCAGLLNAYHREYLNPYVNFHRPCFFPVDVIDHKGKVKKRYPYQEIQTRHEKLKSLPDVSSYLRSEVTLEHLDAIAIQISDNQFAERMVKARSNLLKQTDRFISSEINRLPLGSSFD